MRSLKREGAVEIFHFDGWTVRSKKAGGWKVEGSVGIFTLHEQGSGRWRFVFGNAAKGNQRRQTFCADGLREAVQSAGSTLFGQSVDESAESEKALQVKDLMNRALDVANGEPYHRATLKKHGGYFTAWCKKNRIRHWKDLKPEHLEAYAKFQLARGCSRKTVLHYLEPIRIADRWTGKNETSCVNRIWLDFRLPPKLGKALRYGDRKRRVYLPISSLVELLDCLRGHKFETTLIAGVALQGLCGLQLQEASRLTWDRVDLQSGTIIIEEDRRNDPRIAGVKNEHRVRKLPLPRMVDHILANLWRSKPSREGSDLVIDVPSWNAYSHRVERMLKAWKPAYRIPPKDLRNTLPTEAEKGGWMSIWVRRYFGHAPATMIERSYLAEVEGDWKEDEEVDSFVDKLRENVVNYIDAEVEKCKKNALGPS
jgi:integrase